MKTRRYLGIAVAIAAIALTVGCEPQTRSSGYGSVGPGGLPRIVSTDTPTAGPAVIAQAADPEPAAEVKQPAAADEAAPAPRARTSAATAVTRTTLPDGQNAAQLAIPGGQKANSPVFVETFSPQEVTVGKPFAYKIRVTNLTDMDIEGVVLTALLPAEFEVATLAPEGKADAGKAIWEVGTLEGRGVKTFAVNGKATKVGQLTACSEVAFRNPRICMPVRAVLPALQIVKTGPEDVLICDPFAWKIVVTNSGTGTARNVVVRDELPEGLTAMDGGKSIEAKAGDLAAGQSKEVTVQVKAAKPGKYAGKATASADDGLTAASGDVTTAVRQPVLAVTKEGPKMRYIGRPVPYTITVKNTGDGEARDLVLVDTVPAGMKLTGLSKGAEQSPDGKITWKLGTLASGAEAKVAVSGVAGAAGTLTSSAIAKAKCAEGSATAVTDIKGVPAILLEMVDHPDPVEIGTTTTYTTTITNQGTAEDGNVVVKCVLPPEESYVSSEGPTRETVEGQTVTFAPLPSLAPKAKAVYKVVIKGVKAGDVRFKVFLTSDMMTSPAEKSESTHIYE